MGILLSWKNFNCMLEIDILRNYSPKDSVVMRGDFEGFECPKDAQAPYWPRL